MTTACCHNDGTTRYGLVTGHAYTLLDIVTLSTGVKLAKLRNPWNSEMYTGPWSDTSKLWTAALKKEVNFTGGNDGIFFITWDIYTKYYWGSSVALYQPYKGYQEISVKQSMRSKSWKVTNPIKQEMYIMGDAYAERNFPRGICSKYNYLNKYVLYLFKGDGMTNTQIGKYGFIGWRGHGF